MTVFNIEGSEDQKALRDQLMKITPDQAAQWIENNVTDLASAKLVLKKLARAVVVLAQREKNRE